MTHNNNIDNIFFDVFKRLSFVSYQKQIMGLSHRSLSSNSPPVSASDNSLFDYLGIDDVSPKRLFYE